MTTAVQLLRNELEGAHRVLTGRLAGLGQDEFLWAPVPGAWTVHVRDGRGVLDYAIPDPDPAPFTTIAWRLLHIASCKLMYHEYAFGSAELTWQEIDYPSTVDGAFAWLEAGHRLLVDDLDGLGDGDLDAPRLTNWGEQWPAWRIFWVMIHEEVHHGAEIGVLRDLYRHH